MTLSTHSVIAAAVTKPLSSAHPAFIFVAAVVSHYLADAIPHWDYRVLSMENKEHTDQRHWGKNRKLLLRDLAHFTLDGVVAIAITVLLVRPTTRAQWIWVALAIIGGSLPDFLQGVYALVKTKLLSIHQMIHDAAHSKILLGHYPLIGIPFQLAIVAVCAIILLH